MSARKSRSRNRLGGCFRAFGFTLLFLVVAVAAFVAATLKYGRVNDSVHPNTQSSAHPSSSHVSPNKHRAKRGHPQTEAARDLPADNEEDPSLNPADSSPEKTTEPQTPGSEEQPRVPSKGVILPKDFSRGDYQSKKIALTFDAGASPRPTPLILDTLARHHVHATFFLTGKWIAQNPQLTRRIAAEGHEIGNHTYSHKRLTSLSAGEIAREIDRTEQLVMKLTGHSTKPLLRVPFGARDERVEQVLADLGYRSVYWDVDSWDSVKKDITSDEIEKRVISKIRNGSVVLMHCGSEASAEALDSLLKELDDAGYQQVTVGELMN